MADKKRTEKIFEFVELNFNALSTQINNWLSSVYNKSTVLFNSSSPYGQLLQQIKEFFRWNIIYNKNVIREFDIEQASTKRMIINAARISGHNPSRAISAKGTLKFKLKQGIYIDQKVAGSAIVIYDDTKIKNKTNNLIYSLKVGTDKNIYPLTSGCQFFVNVVQGQYETQTYTGDGTKNQSIQVVIDKNQIIDNFDFQITVDGLNMQVKDHLWDMLEDENSCFTRTGFNGGLDTYFGNGVNGMIPKLGSVIEIKYLLTDGVAGSILNAKINDWEFIDNIYDSDGNVLVVSELFDIMVETDITFSSDGESLEYTKSVIPYVSRNFVLATPQQFMYHLKKLNMFSNVYAFNTLDMIRIDIDNDNLVDTININEMYLFLIPKITNYFEGDTNYFNVPFDAFYLDESEKQRVITYLKMQGIISISSSIKILDPDFKMYVINVYVRKFENEPEENIKEQIIDYLSTYFSENERYDRIVKADILRGLKNIEGIDSINLEFISKANEDYHKDGAIFKQQKQRTVIETTYTSSSHPLTYNRTSYNENEMIGVDPLLGDIVINRAFDRKKNQFPILRGGWSDRNGIYYHEDPKSTNEFSTVNIIFRDQEEKVKSSKPVLKTEVKSASAQTTIKADVR